MDGIEDIRRRIEECSKNAEQMNADVEKWMTSLKAGDMPDMMGVEPPIILKKGEALKLVFPAPSIVFLEARSVSTRISGSAKLFGMRMRGSQSVSTEQIKEIDRGMLTLTNKRLVFTGSKKTINVNLAKVISVEPHEQEYTMLEGWSHRKFMAQGIMLRREGKSRAEYFVGWEGLEMIMRVEDRTYSRPLTSEMLVLFVKNLVADIE